MKVLIEKMIRYGFLGIVGAMFIMAGCSGGGGGSSSGGASNTGSPNPGSEFVGSWEMSDSSGGVTFYLYVDSNNTFVVADVPDKTHEHFSGTWSVSNGTFRAPFTNPGVGTGDLVCTITNGVMNMDFIEHWHSPDKHVPYTGRKF
jgi:hypothetical protein